MARPKHHHPQDFVASECVESTDISTRNFQLLRDTRQGPFDSQWDTSGLYNENILAEIALIGAATSAGFELGQSAAVVMAFLDCYPGQTAARLARLDSFNTKIPFDSPSWFHAYQLLRENHPDAYRPGQAHDQDMVIIVADREFVLEGTLGVPRLPRVSDPGVDQNGPFPLGRMVDLEKGAKPYFVPINEEYPQTSEAFREAKMRFQRAARESVGQHRVNASLAIRRAFDCVYALRKAKGGPLWPPGAC